MGEYAEVSISRLIPNPDNPRETLGDLDELAASIDAIGVLQRLLVAPEGDGTLMVVDGHRRYWAMRSINYDRPIPVEIREMSRADRLAAAVAAGTFTRPISPIDQAKAFRALQELGLNQVQIAERTGCAQPMISTRLRLLELTPAQQSAIHEGRMTLNQAKQATYLLGRRAPDKAPRKVGPRSKTIPCPECGHAVPLPTTGAVGHQDLASRALAEPISRGEALAIIEAHG